MAENEQFGLGTRREGEPEYKECTQCGAVKPIGDFYLVRAKRVDGSVRYSRQPYCRACRNENSRRSKQSKRYNAIGGTINEKGLKRSQNGPNYYPDRAGYTCRTHCERYPCFRGIDNVITNLAKTCCHFKEKEQ